MPCGHSRITRRSACLAAAAGLTLPAITHGAETEAPKFPGEPLLASALYGTLPLAEVLAEAPKLGAKSIDLWRKPHADHWEQAQALGDAKFAELLGEHRMTLGAVTFWNGDFDGAFRFAHRHGARRLITGFVPAAAGLDAFLNGIRPRAARAKELGITLAIENHGAGFDDIRRFADAASKDGVGVALAPYHLPQDAANIAALVKDLGERLQLFYAWQHGHGCMKKLPKEEELLQLPGRGDLDFGPLMKALRTIDYSGPIEVFMHPVPRGIPILPTAAEVSRELLRAHDYLKSTLETRSVP